MGGSNQRLRYLILRGSNVPLENSVQNPLYLERRHFPDPYRWLQAGDLFKALGDRAPGKTKWEFLKVNSGTLELLRRHKAKYGKLRTAEGVSQPQGLG